MSKRLETVRGLAKMFHLVTYSRTSHFHDPASYDVARCTWMAHSCLLYRVVRLVKEKLLLTSE